jgi:hypothetical protein
MPHWVAEASGSILIFQFSILNPLAATAAGRGLLWQTEKIGVKSKAVFPLPRDRLG